MNQDQPTATITISATWRWWARPALALALLAARCQLPRVERCLVQLLVRRGLRVRLA
jgi:hypothetical protein